MYCLKPPMTQPPEGTTPIGFIIHQCVYTAYAMSHTVYLKAAISKGYIWKRDFSLSFFMCLSLSLSAGSWSCHVCLDLLKDKASAYGEA